MTTKMGVREFRDNFTTIARDAREPVIVTNHDKIVGWFTPAKRPPRSVAEIIAELDGIRRGVEARGIDVAGRMRELGLEDETLFDDPVRDSRPAKSKAKGRGPVPGGREARPKRTK
jgi:hypothetical protein